MTVNILGTDYEMSLIPEADDPMLKDNDGYCDYINKKIIISKKLDNEKVANYFRTVKRHEITHAYMYESGLGVNWEHKELGQEETTVDWIATQFPKMAKTFIEVDAM